MLASETNSKTAWVLDSEIADVVRHKARQLSRLQAFSPADQPDIEQELMLELIRKASRYDSERAKLVTYASRITETKAASLVRAARAHKRSYIHESVSLNETIPNADGDPTEYAQLVEESAGRRHTGQRVRSHAEQNQLKLDIQELNRELPPSTQRVAAVLSHASEFATGEILGMSRRETAGHVSLLRDQYTEHGLVS